MRVRPAATIEHTGETWIQPQRLIVVVNCMFVITFERICGASAVERLGEVGTRLSAGLDECGASLDAPFGIFAPTRVPILVLRLAAQEGKPTQQSHHNDHP